MGGGITGCVGTRYGVSHSGVGTRIGICSGMEPGAGMGDLSQHPHWDGGPVWEWGVLTGMGDPILCTGRRAQCWHCWDGSMHQGVPSPAPAQDGGYQDGEAPSLCQGSRTGPGDPVWAPVLGGVQRRAGGPTLVPLCAEGVRPGGPLPRRCLTALSPPVPPAPRGDPDSLGVTARDLSPGSPPAPLPWGGTKDPPLLVLQHPSPIGVSLTSLHPPSSSSHCPSGDPHSPSQLPAWTSPTLRLWGGTEQGSGALSLVRDGGAHAGGCRRAPARDRLCGCWCSSGVMERV